MQNIFRNNHWLFPFFLLSILMTVISFVTSHFVISENMVYDAISNSVPSEKIEDIMSNRFKYEWLSYLLNPILIIITFLVSSAVISIGVHLKSYSISFKKILTVVAWSNLIFLLPKIIKLIYFLFFNESFTLENYRNFHPFSLLFFIDKKIIAA